MAIRILIALLVLGGAGLYARTLDAHRVSASAAPDLARLPASIDGWVSRDMEISETVAEVLDADVTLQRVYRSPEGAEVHVFVAYFSEQAVNSQIHSPRNCVPGAGWRIAETGRVDLALDGARERLPEIRRAAAGRNRACNPGRAWAHSIRRLQPAA